MATIHLLIKGLVQGVGYRASARDEARRLGLTGWVKNTPQGQVEAVASGPVEALNAFVAWCGTGPLLARVSAVEVSDLPAQHFEEFVIQR